MFETDYENRSYWQGIHKEYSGTLRAVGWPTLSEEFNRLKYVSEAESITSVFDSILTTDDFSILEVGVGIGFWTDLKRRYFQARGATPRITALDLSTDALELVRKKFPDVSTAQADLTAIPLDSFGRRFDLVTAIMVLLHLTDMEGYLHALKFCARSVSDGGHLLIYEPLLFKNYTPFGSQAFDAHEHNSMPRSLSMVDNVLHNEGFSRVRLTPGASWLLNSPIQAHSALGYRFKRMTWNLVVRALYRSERRTAFFAPILFALDRLQKGGGSDSGSFALYRRVAGTNAKMT